MMKCKTIRGKLLDPDLGRLDDKKRAEMEEHLKQCPECREYRKEQMLLGETLSQVGAMKFSPAYLQDFRDRLNQRLDSKERSRGWIRRWLHRLDVSPLPTLSQAAAVVWLMILIALQFPGVGPAILQAVGM